MRWSISSHRHAAHARERRASAIPELRLDYRATSVPPVKQRAYAKFQGPGDLCDDDHAAGLLQELSPGAAQLPRARLWRHDRGRRQRPGNPLPLRFRARRRAGPWRAFGCRTRAAFSDAASRQGRRRDRRRHLGLPRGRAAAPRAVRRGAGRLFAAAPRALHRHRLALGPALDPAHQLSPLCRPVRPLGRGGAGERDGPFEQLVLPGGVTIERGLDEAAVGGAGRLIALAPLPDAGLSPDPQGRTRA